MTAVAPTQDGMGYYVVVGERRAFVSSYHLVPDKEAQLKMLNLIDQTFEENDELMRLLSDS